MMGRTFGPAGKLCLAGALLLPGAAVGWQFATATSAAAASTTTVAFAWGDNSSGELGNGATGPAVATPVAVSLPAGVSATAVAAAGGEGDPALNGFAGYAIGSDGHLYSWGDNSSGELGNGTSGGSSDAPGLVSLPAGVTPTAISAAQGIGYALDSHGTVYAWGDNTYGALGNGTIGGSSATPAAVALPTGVTATAIAGGYESGYAIGSDGHLYAWGDNFYGELGNGEGPTNSGTPVVVSLPSGVTPKAVAGGGGTGYAIGSDGKVYAWGLNASGQLGNGNTTNSPTPVVVSLPSGVSPTAIAGAGGFAFAIGSDGHLYAWGNDSGGQLGNDSTTNSSLPVVVQLPAGVTPTAISGNYFSGYAIGSDGNLYAWGGNSTDDLGNGTVGGISATPVLVSLPTGSTPLQLAPEPGSSSSFALVTVPDAAPRVTTQPANQSLAATQNATFTAGASGFPLPAVQWQVSTNGTTFTAITGATSDSLILPDVTVSESGNEYEAVFTNSDGSTTTDPATLTVSPTAAPVVTLNPTSQTVPDGAPVTFSAAATGTPTPAVSWQFSFDGGTEWMLSGITTTAFTLTASAGDDALEVEAVFTNVAGMATTTPAILTVTIAPPTTSVLTPATGATVVGDIWLDASAQSSVPIGTAPGTVPIGSVRFEVSGGSLSDFVVDTGTDTRYGWIGAWDTSDVPNGTYTLQSVASYFGTGGSGTSPGVTVTVDNPPLHTQVTIPGPGATLSGSAAILDASASGTSPVTNVHFVVSGGGLTDQVVGTAVATLYGWLAEWNTTTVTNGTYTLQSVATETGGTTVMSPGVTITVHN
jgi:alpha-tubulin suppressor-like RCC1 family protein